MMQLSLPSVRLRFGPYTVGFHTRQPGTAFYLDDRHEPFRVPTPAGPATLDVECSLGEVVASDAPIVFTSGDAWELRRLPDGSEEFLFRFGPGYSTPTYLLTFDPSFERATLVERPEDGRRLVCAAAGPIVEFLVARLVGRHGSLEAHASTVIVDGEAYVFVGHSGAGKSTLAGIAEQMGAFIPTDDRTILSFEDGGVMAWGTPWNGTLEKKSPEGAPVRGVYLLQQAPVDRLVPLPPSEAIKRLFVRLIQPRLSAYELDRTFEALELLCARTWVGALEFTPSPRAFELVLTTPRTLSAPLAST